MDPTPTSITPVDIRCAEVGRQLAEIKKMEEKILNEALAVLEEQGPYAMFLYISARYKEGGLANAFQTHCLPLLREVFGDKIPTGGDALKTIEQLANDLDDLLFARDLLRNVLAYARYHLKAKGS